MMVYLSTLSRYGTCIHWIEDNEEPTTFAQINGVIYDIQDRTTKDGKSKGTLVCCSPYDLVNNATKLSRRFGKGGGKPSVIL